MSIHDDVLAAIGRGCDPEAIYTRLPGVSEQRIDKSIDVLTQSGRLAHEEGQIHPRTAGRCKQLHLEDAIDQVLEVHAEITQERDAAQGDDRQSLDRRLWLLERWIEISNWLLDQERT